MARSFAAASDIEAILISRGSSQTFAAHAAGARRFRRDQQPAMPALDRADLIREFFDIPLGGKIGGAIAHRARIACRAWRVATDLPNSRHA
jgi:hypothetical protein